MIPAREPGHARTLKDVTMLSPSLIDNFFSYVIDTGIDVTHPEFQGREYKSSGL